MTDTEFVPAVVLVGQSEDMESVEAALLAAGTRAIQRLDELLMFTGEVPASTFQILHAIPGVIEVENSINVTVPQPVGPTPYDPK